MRSEPAAIRPARLGDAAEWARMRRALWPDDVDADDEVAEYFRHPPADCAVFVCERPEGDLAGFIEMGLRDYAEGCATSPVAYVEGWYVDPDARGRGLGRALMRAGEDWARARGLTEMASDALLFNMASAAAHRALGFVEVERIVCFRRDLSTAEER
jgi:aminoglycoside 6'-N-acetyltransferase I